MTDQNPSSPSQNDKNIVDKSIDAGIADETAAYDNAIVPTEGGAAQDESEAQPS